MPLPLCLTGQADHFGVASNRNVDDISTGNFVLPKLGPKLKNWACTLYDGMGFFIIRGLDAGEFSAEDNLAMYIGTSSYIGDERGVQDGDGNVIGWLTCSAKSFVLIFGS